MSGTLPDKDLTALVDRLLLAQGRVDPLELLLAADLLAYRDFEGWKTGRLPGLQERLTVGPAEAAGLLRRAAAYARAQGMLETPLPHAAWGGETRPLHIGAHAGLRQACSALFAPPAERRQLDLFHDSRSLVLEEDIRRALTERRPDAAREATALLMRQEPGHRHLRGYLRLIQVNDEMGALSADTRLQALTKVEPLADELLGFRARDFLAPLWSAFAESLAARRFDPAHRRLHASYAWARAGQWDKACAAVEAEPDWCSQPDLVIAHGAACWRGRRQAEARRDWMWLCWEHPLEAERLLGSRDLPDRRLAELWDRFGDSDLNLETEDFPSWLLVADPGPAVALSPDEAPRDGRGDAYRLPHRLVTGEDDIALRRRLAEVHADLLSLFLSRRDSRRE